MAKLAAVVNMRGLRAQVQKVTTVSGGSGSGDCSVSLDEDSLDFDLFADSQTVGITAANDNTITYGTSDASWLSVTGPSAGSGTATVTVTRNLTASARTGTVTICGNAVEISQAAGPPEVCGGPHLIHWWTAQQGVYSDAGTTLAGNNDAVQQWNDQIGSSNLLQATSGYRPAYKTNRQNLLPAVVFDGTDDHLQTGLNFGISSNVWQVFLVGKLRTWTASVKLWGWSSATKYALACRAAAYGGVSPEGMVGNLHAEAIPSDIKPGAWSIIAIQSTPIPAHAKANVNAGATQDGDGASYGGTGAGSTFFVAGGPDESVGLSPFAALDVAEILVYDCNGDDAATAAIIDYLNDRWAVF